MEKLGITGKCLNIIKSLYKDHTRKVKTQGGYSEWIKCDRGVKQGCVLSPLLFALYIAGIGRDLEELEKGVQIGETNIPALFFADDMALIAESEADLAVLLSKLRHEVEIKKLEFNFSKTEIMKFGLGAGAEKGWYIALEGKLVGQIEETNEYKYLGVKIGRSHISQQQTNRVLQEIPRKMGLVKAIARSAPDKCTAADVYWRQWAKPTILYGTEILHTRSSWITCIERKQNIMGRWILGTNRTAPSTGVRGELGWTSIKGEVMYRKIIYWYKIQKMASNRWPKKITQALARGEWASKWGEEMQTAHKELGKYGNLEEASRGKNWKKNIRRIWHRWEGKEWKKAMEKKEEMKLYPKNKLLGKQEFIGSTKAKQIFIKYRIGDFVNRDFKQYQKCPACKADIKEIRTHIFLQCRATREVREECGYKTQIGEKLANGLTPPQIMRGILEDEEIHNIRAIYKIHQEWEKEKEGQEEDKRKG